MKPSPCFKRRRNLEDGYVDDMENPGDMNPSTTPFRKPVTLNLSSVERTNTASVTDTNLATFNLKEQIKDFVAVELISYNIAATMFNVNTGVNDSFYISCSDSVAFPDTVLSIAATNYTGTTLATALMNALNAYAASGIGVIGGSFLVTFDTVTGKLTYQQNVTVGGVGVTFTFDFSNILNVKQTFMVSSSNPAKLATSTLTLSSSTYTTSKLITAVNAKLATYLTTAVGVVTGTITCSYDSNSNRLAFSQNVKIDGATVTIYVTFDNIQILSKSLGREMGFLSDPGVTYSLASSGTLVASCVTQLDRPRSLIAAFLDCNWPADKWYDGDGTLTDRTVHFYIPMPFTSGTVVYSNSNVYEVQSLDFPNPVSLQLFKVAFYDPDFGNYINFQGGDWSLQLKFHFGRKRARHE